MYLFDLISGSMAESIGILQNISINCVHIKLDFWHQYIFLAEFAKYWPSTYKIKFVLDFAKSVFGRFSYPSNSKERYYEPTESLSSISESDDLDDEENSQMKVLDLPCAETINLISNSTPRKVRTINRVK